ncbi:hypothetical protein CLV90_2502 [Maribacter spongiicola]|uniref:Uncharacterized protein n=1 Tax=Maribacter spongiicola TaxID=1206753 RepID=A0A4R7K401_9FLAO|nr:hypothetical protein [Maribacter spongiicola]TDT45415.1 hypothetical protein CLV90_2502 [Maribacter spongiicola]
MKLLGIGSRIRHKELGKGVITNVSSTMYWVTFMDSGLETIDIESEYEVIDAIENEVDAVSFFDVESSLVAILQKWSDATQRVAIADKWKGGNLILAPGEAGMSTKEIPINTFFHKIVMVRDRIRVMEQKINSSKNLDDQEKVDLQQYITRIYGSLTSFNVLFKVKSDHFIGEKGGK